MADPSKSLQLLESMLQKLPEQPTAAELTAYFRAAYIDRLIEKKSCFRCGADVTKTPQQHHLWIIREGEESEAVCVSCAQDNLQGKWSTREYQRRRR